MKTVLERAEKVRDIAQILSRGFLVWTGIPAHTAEHSASREQEKLHTY